MLTNLQILRAFAALNVVLFHIIEIGTEQGFGVPALEFLRGWGANGIDIFFVLSGFIMVYIAEMRPRKPIDFLTSRASRIVPIYWLLTALGVMLILVSGDFRGEPVSIDPILSSFAFMTRWTTLDMPILYVGWTLEWEMLFYLIFGACLLVKSRVLQFFLPLYILSMLVILGGQDPIILEFGFGMIIAKLSKLNFIKARSAVVTILGAGLLLASIWVKPDLPQPILWGLPSALLVMGLVNLPQLKFRLGEHLGDASYSIYLIQVFTIPVFYKVIDKTLPELPTLLLAMGCLAATAIAGSLLHLLVEKPLQRMFSQKKPILPSYDMARLRAAVGLKP